jgi:4'-phosphopantetheinyl transferase
VTRELIDVWISTLTVPDARRRELEVWLTSNERDRAGSFRQERDRHRAVIARGVLREILATWMQCSPAHLTLTHDLHGKPHVESRGVDRVVPQFSVSHSGELVVIGVHRSYRLGVDVESLPAPAEWRSMMRLVCTPREQALLSRDTVRGDGARFLQLWTRKEAVLKAIGAGLQLAPEQVDVCARECETAEHGRWRLKSFRVGRDAVGAVAAPVGGWALRVRRWEGLPAV